MSVSPILVADDDPVGLEIGSVSCESDKQKMPADVRTGIEGCIVLSRVARCQDGWLPLRLLR